MNLAANGKPSNLTAEQYGLVRTSAFKKWFGDWEKSPETASKVVDSNGEPLVAYRGNQEQLGYEFTLGHNLLEKPTVNDFGHFFTPEKWVAQRYAEDFMQTKKGYILEVFLNAKNVLDLTKLGSKSYGERFVNYLKDSRISFLGFEDLISEVQEFNYTKDFDGSDIVANVYDFFDNFPKLRELFIKNNISGIKFYENSRGGGITYVVFDSNQIKLADGTNTTFDANNPDIRYADGGSVGNIIVTNEYEEFDSKVFNELEDEILYGFVVKDENKRIGLVNVEDDIIELGIGYILGLEVFEKNKGYGKKIIKKIFELHHTQHAFGGKATSTSKGFWLNLGGEFDEFDEYSFILSKDKLNYSDGGNINNFKYTIGGL